MPLHAAIAALLGLLLEGHDVPGAYLDRPAEFIFVRVPKMEEQADGTVCKKFRYGRLNKWL